VTLVRVHFEVLPFLPLFLRCSHLVSPQSPFQKHYSVEAALDAHCTGFCSYKRVGRKEITSIIWIEQLHVLLLPGVSSLADLWSGLWIKAKSDTMSVNLVFHFLCLVQDLPQSGTQSIFVCQS
jgi:hypothetical protein